MKARKKDSNDEWQDIAYVQFVDSYILQPADMLEFDTAPMLKPAHTNIQISEEVHWQDVRERAAIAAMHGLINNCHLEQLAVCAVEQADALVEQLKKK